MDSDELSRDMLLFAYVDGELDETQRHVVESLISHDPRARERVAQARSLHRLLQAAYFKSRERSASK